MTETRPIMIGRYVLHRQIASGGMATIHIARLMGDEGFCRIVAAKRLHPEFAQDAEFVAMFLDEARIASRVHHHNVVPVLDVVTDGSDVMLVQEYVHGVPLSWLLRAVHDAKAYVPIEIAVSIACQVLGGLHAAHETVDELGVPLDVVHRDVSPQNIMVAIDGGARLLDFGVAKTAMSAHITRNGVFKGKLAYSAPEQVRGAATQQSDLYALCVVLWELLCGRRLHSSCSGEAHMVHRILTGQLATPTEALAGERAELGEAQWAQIRALEPIVMRGLATDARARWATAQELESVLTATVSPASTLEVASWVRTIGKGFLDDRDRILAEEETSWRRTAGTRAGNDAAPATEVERPPIWRSHRLLLGLATACVMSIVLLAFAIRRQTETAAAATVLSPSASAASSAKPSASPSLEQAHAQSPPTVTEIVTTNSTPAPDPAPPPMAASSLRPAFAPAKPPGARSPPSGIPHTVAHPAVRIARVAPPPPPPPPSLATLPAPATDCNPPYYFEGAKKIFKPACL